MGKKPFSLFNNYSQREKKTQQCIDREDCDVPFIFCSLSLPKVMMIYKM